jgi:hypothetical protein
MEDALSRSCPALRIPAVVLPIGAHSLVTESPILYTSWFMTVEVSTLTQCSCPQLIELTTPRGARAGLAKLGPPALWCLAPWRFPPPPQTVKSPTSVPTSHLAPQGSLTKPKGPDIKLRTAGPICNRSFQGSLTHGSSRLARDYLRVVTTCPFPAFLATSC